MSYALDSRLGEQLYRLLPEVYRTRDKKTGQAGVGSGIEDLAKYLDAHGHLLDLIHATLEQQLRDALPKSSQDWLLPYFAQLLAANIVSPESDGRHAEITHTVSWRQRKGTLKCAEEIAEAVGQMEVEIQEGWKRVAMTSRIGMPLIPARVWDDTLDIDMTVPSEATRHPTLPAAMVDLRRSSRAVEALSTNPAARISSFGGVKQTWRQTNRHGVPCFPGSFDDVSRRTVDIRTPNSGKGHYHHKRLLAYAPPPTGLFPFDPLIRTWDEALQENFIDVKHESGVLIYSNRTDRIIEITDKVTLEKKQYRIEGINFQSELEIPEGGKLELFGSEVKKVSVNTFSTDEFLLTATDCLFDELSSEGRVELDSCTVLVMAYLNTLEAIDCIFMGIEDTEITGKIAYSRIPENAQISSDRKKMFIKSNLQDATQPVTDHPQFISGQSSLASRAVLSPQTPKSIYEGASDQGEMGYYHRGRRNRPVHITGDSNGNLSLTPPTDGSYPLEDLIFNADVTVTDGKLVLIRSAAKSLTVNTELSYDGNGNVVPSLEATDCLFDNLNVSSGLARLQYNTVMNTADCKHLQASDCIFAGSITGVEKQEKKKGSPSFLNCIRYSSVPVELMDDIASKEQTDPVRKVAEALRFIGGNGKISLGTNTLETPIFPAFDYCTEENGDWESIRRPAEFGEYGYGVLAPVTPGAVRFGAEDGGEMGAYHHKYYSLKVEAVLDKMREFLPVGIEPVPIQDTRLLRVPPETKNLSNGGTS